MHFVINSLSHFSLANLWPLSHFCIQGANPLHENVNGYTPAQYARSQEMKSLVEGYVEKVGVLNDTQSNNISILEIYTVVSTWRYIFK